MVGTEADVWWYAVDACAFREWNDLMEAGGSTAATARLGAATHAKCVAADRLLKLLTPRADQPSSLFGDRSPPLLPLRRDLLPATTQRILDATGGYALPLSPELQVRALRVDEWVNSRL